MKWQDEPESGDSPEEERTGYGRWEEGQEEDGTDGSPGTEDEVGEDEAREAGPARGDQGPANPGATEAGAANDTHGTCELCGGPTLERHCKILCLRCGYQRDCSDP
jgi:hypothetical protein